MTATVNLAPLAKLRFVDNNGVPLAGGKVFTYTAGSTTKQNTYTDASGATPNSNPVILDSRGEAAIWFDQTLAYKVTLAPATDTDPPTAPIWTVDNIPAGSGQVSTFIALLATSAGAPSIGYLDPATSAQLETLADVAREKLTILRFIPAAMRAAVLNYTSTDDHTSYFAAAMANANGRDIIVPAGKYNVSTLAPPKASRFTMIGEVADYNEVIGSVINVTGSGACVSVGVNDGNPDVTGYARNQYFRKLCFNTSTAVTGVSIANAALCGVYDCAIYGFSGKGVFLHETVLIEIAGNDIRGSQPASGNYGIYFDTVQYFGNFVTNIHHNHIYQLNWGIRFAGGRNQTVNLNTFENIKGYTIANPSFGGLFVFETAGYLSNIVITENYCESQRGWVLYGASFTGAILNFVFEKNELGGSGDSANPNPGVGNLPKSRILTHQISGNLITDGQMNTNAALGLPAGAYFPNTQIFDPLTTMLLDVNSSQSYEDDIVYALRPNELLKSLGDFHLATGGTAGTYPTFMSGAGTTPAGWTNDISGATFSLIADAISGLTALTTAGSGGTFNLFHAAITVPNVAYATFYAIAFTARGWTHINVQGSSVWDSGSSSASYSTQVVTFSVAANTSSITIQFGTNATTFTIAEARLWQIGPSEYNVPGPGSMNAALIKACRRLMKRGAY